MFQRLEISARDAAEKRGQADPFLFVAPDDWPERPANLNDDSEFFLKLTDEGIFVGFSRIDFSAWEFPFSAEVFSHGAQASQQFPTVILNDATNHFHHDS